MQTSLEGLQPEAQLVKPTYRCMRISDYCFKLPRWGAGGGAHALEPRTFPAQEEPSGRRLSAVARQVPRLRFQQALGRLLLFSCLLISLAF